MSKCSCTNISYLDFQTILAHFEQHAMIECLREMKENNLEQNFAIHAAIQH